MSTEIERNSLPQWITVRAIKLRMPFVLIRYMKYAKTWKQEVGLTKQTSLGSYTKCGGKGILLLINVKTGTSLYRSQ